jgi:hypothetical protein
MPLSQPGALNGRYKYPLETIQEAYRLHAIDKLPQRRIAEILNVPRCTISDWLTGRRRGTNAATASAKLDELREDAYQEKVEELLDKRRLEAIRRSFPKDAEAYMEGLFYKRGRFDRVFYWDGAEWRKSTYAPSQIVWSFKALG